MLLGAAAMLTACSENSWNDHLDGFHEPVISDVATVTYTLTDADYSAIANNATNKALAEADGESEALKAIGTLKSFVSTDQAHKYVPAFLASTSFPQYALSDGSSVKVTYNVDTEINADVQAINAGTAVYSVTEEDYRKAWDSAEDYVNAFAPMTPAAASLPGFLKTAFPQAEAGDYAVASYNWSAINPIFTTPEGGDTWKVTNVLGGIELDQAVEVHGIVTATCTRGFILTDNGGSILVYGSGFNEADVPLFSLVNVSGTVSAYGTAFQIALDSATVEVVGEGEYEYPEPVTLTPEMVQQVCARTDNASPFYATVDATVSVSGNYFNLILDGLEGFDVSAYYALDYFKDLMEDGGKFRFTGYVIGKSGQTHCNMVITGINSANRSRGVKRAPAAALVTEPQVALYRYTGSAWSAASSILMLQPADYTTMGQKYSNLSGTGPQDLLPLFLKLKYPFAAEEDVKIVCYNYYDGSASSYRAMQFVLREGEWTRNAGATTEQYSRADGKWMYNPSIVLDLPSDKSAFPTAFYQACVDYVFETQCVPLGDDNIKSGKFWVTSYGNNEYWSGTSAYQTNVDIRPAAARAQYAAGFEGMDDDQVKDFIITNFLDHTLPYVLGKYYPDFGPLEGMDVTMTVNFVTYDGGRVNQQVVYAVEAPGKFRRLSSTIGSQPE